MAEQNYDEGDLVHFDPTGGPRDVGSGGGFGANLYNLYRAGQIEMPDLASRYVPMVYSLSGATASVELQSGLAGGPAALTGLADVMDRLHHALRSTCLSVADTAEAISIIARDYASTDQDAAHEFNFELRHTDDADFTDPVPSIPDLPGPRDSPPIMPNQGTPPALPDLDPPDQGDIELPGDDAGSGSDDLDDDHRD